MFETWCQFIDRMTKAFPAATAEHEPAMMIAAAVLCLAEVIEGFAPAPLDPNATGGGDDD